MLCIQRTSTGEGQLSACFVLGSHKLYFLFCALSQPDGVSCFNNNVSQFNPEYLKWRPSTTPFSTVQVNPQRVNLVPPSDSATVQFFLYLFSPFFFFCVFLHMADLLNLWWPPNSPPTHPRYQFVCVCTPGGPLSHHPLTHTTSLCVCTRGGP